MFPNKMDPCQIITMQQGYTWAKTFHSNKLGMDDLCATDHDIL